ncbi:hypothetical protein CBR_g39496 [Chara braunii]|uniref:Uncharacterized protein n=1 Tax=Chara braunii TaxID=69332 RepID=A0A388LS54_CHABU|nr:hypothetical protein CBR_g39496 [Chara braunii]|eukprot:GBG85032.1 hypothetical protein CBR_g39496 [Chara braunii]
MCLGRLAGEVVGRCFGLLGGEVVGRCFVPLGGDVVGMCFGRLGGEVVGRCLGWLGGEVVGRWWVGASPGLVGRWWIVASAGSVGGALAVSVGMFFGWFGGDVLRPLGGEVVLVMAVVHYFPLTPSLLSSRAYKYTLFGAAFTYAFSIYLQHAVPSPMKLASIKAWFGRVAASSDFLSLLYCFIFISNMTPIVLVVIPLGAVGLYQCSQHLKRNFSRAALYRNYLQKGCLWLEQNATQIQLFSANAEVFVGFMLIIRAFTLLSEFYALRNVLYYLEH